MYYAKKFLEINGSDPKPEPKEKKKQKAIPKVSEKRKVENKEYTTLRKVYLENHKFCEVKMKGCTWKSTEIHHDEGRSGVRLNNVANFVAICRNCHNIVENKNLKVKSKPTNK